MPTCNGDAGLVVSAEREFDGIAPQQMLAQIKYQTTPIDLGGGAPQFLAFCAFDARFMVHHYGSFACQRHELRVGDRWGRAPQAGPLNNRASR